MTRSEILITKAEIDDIKERIPARPFDGHPGRTYALRMLIRDRQGTDAEMMANEAYFDLEGNLHVPIVVRPQVWVDPFTFMLAEHLNELNPIWEGENVVTSERRAKWAA